MELPHESMPSQVVSGRATQKNGKVLGLSPETAGAEQLAVSILESLVFFSFFLYLTPVGMNR